MSTLTGEIQFVIAITLLILTFTSFVIIFVFIHQRHYHQYLRNIEDVKNKNQQELLKVQLEMQEQTFRSISQEIHDNIGQILSLVRLHISSIQTEENSASARKVTSSKELLDQAIQDLRDLSKRLNTEFVQQQSLAESLRFQLNLIQRTELYETTFAVHGDERPLDAEKKLIVFRIAQEALNNIIKHAGAKLISVLLMYLPNEIILSIKDDGQGFDMAALHNPEEPRKGIGTNNMHYRANLIGAAFSLQSKPGEGTLAQLKLPTE